MVQWCFLPKFKILVLPNNCLWESFVFQMKSTPNRVGRAAKRSLGGLTSLPHLTAFLHRLYPWHVWALPANSCPPEPKTRLVSPRVVTDLNAWLKQCSRVQQVTARGHFCFAQSTGEVMRWQESPWGIATSRLTPSAWPGSSSRFPQVVPTPAPCLCLFWLFLEERPHHQPPVSQVLPSCTPTPFRMLPCPFSSSSPPSCCPSNWGCAVDSGIYHCFKCVSFVFLSGP